MLAFSESNISIRDPTATNSALSAAYGNFSARCRGISQNALRAVRVLTPTPGDTSQPQQQLLQHQTELAQYFTRTSGYRIEYTAQSSERIAEEVLFQVQTNVSLYDAWVLDVPSSEAALRAGGVAVLDELVADAAAQQRLQDSDIHPFLQKYGAMYGNRRIAIVLGGIVPLLYWRRDLFAAAGLPPDRPPATWEELLAAAAALNGTDLNGDGAPDPALCWNSDGCVDAGTVLSNILASMTQYQGLSSGWLFRPDDMSPLADGPPLERALELFRGLRSMEARGGATTGAGAGGCTYAHWGFFDGSCAITIKSAQQFKVAELRYPDLRGRVGVAPLPGSARVWDRGARAWLSCGAGSGAGTAATGPCPHATLETPLVLPSHNRTTTTTKIETTENAASNDTAAAAAAAGANPGLSPIAGRGSGVTGGAGGRNRRRSLLADASAIPPGAAAAPPSPSPSSSPFPSPSSPSSSSSIWVNRAPFCGMTALLASVDARTPPDYARAAFTFFSLATDPDASWALLATDSIIGPFRRQHFDPANLGRWLAMNYSADDLRPFLDAYRRALEHPNAALPLRLPGAAALRDTLYWATQRVLQAEAEAGAGAAAAVAEAVTARLQANLRDVGMPLPEIQRLYWETIGYEGGPPPAPDGAQSWISTRGARVGVGSAAAVAGAALLAVAGAAWYRRRRRVLQRRTLFGRALAPGASPATSLVVTDIVDSTRLWETVSPAAMTRAVQLHHETLRSLLQLHNGYESATEGDAFILSFYSAADAVAFALRAQAALLYQPWPEVLFAQEPCRPQYALCRAPGGPPERSRAAIPRLPRGTLPEEIASGVASGASGSAVAGASGPLRLHRGGGGSGGAAAGSGATHGEDRAVNGGWLGVVSNSQLQLKSGKLKLMSGALSLPLKRRPRAGFGAGGGGSGSVAVSTSIGGDGGGGGVQPVAPLTAAGRQPQLACTTPQLTFAALPPPPPPPRDGFASHSLSQLLLLGPAEGGSAGGGAGAGGGGRSRPPPHSLRPASTAARDTHKMRQVRLAMSRARNASGTVVPFVRRHSGALSAIQTSDGDASVAPHGSAAPAAARAAATAVSDGGGSATAAGGRTAPVTLDRYGGGGGGAAAAAADDDTRSGGGGGNGATRACALRGLTRSDSQPRENPSASATAATAAATAAGAAFDISPPAALAALEGTSVSAGSGAAPAAEAAGARAAGAVGAGAMPMLPPPYMWGLDSAGGTEPTYASEFNAPVMRGSLGPTAGSAADSVYGGDRGGCGGGSGGCGGLLRGFSGDAVAEAAAGVSIFATAPAAAAEAAMTLAATATATAEGMPTGGSLGYDTVSVASCVVVGDSGGGAGAGAGAGGAPGENDRLSAATFSGQWTAPRPTPALPPPTAADRAHTSLPLTLLAPGTAIAGGAADCDGDLESLLAVRGGDIESDPEPERDPEPKPRDAEAGEEPPASGRRTRGSRFSRRTRGSTRTSPAMGLVTMALISQAGLPTAVSAAAASGGGMREGGGGGRTLSAMQGSAGGFLAGGAGASSAVFVSGSIATSGSGALTNSLSLMPYRRMSVHNNLAALMGSVAGPGLSLESGTLNSGSVNGGLGGGGGGGVVRSLSLGAYYRQLFQPCAPGAPGAVRVAGGLSVRMGVHSGVANTQVSYNRVAGRTQYSGAALEAAKAVCDAAQGGMVLLSASCFAQLTASRPGGGGGGPGGGGGSSGGREPPHAVLHAGAHRLKGAEQQPQELYMAQSRELLARLAFLGPVRSSELVEPGALEAPLGEVSMGAVVVAGLPTLMAWDKEATEEALATFRRVVVTVAMRRLGGHLVEEGQGRVLAAFGHPFDAIRWAAACEALLKEADWSEALLSHELAEEVQGPVLLNSHMDAPVLTGHGELSRMLFRGLRIRGAVDCAPVKAELAPATGRLSYRGNLAHSVQRIAAYVSTGQVVCTRRAWRAYEAALDLAAAVAGAADVVGASLGPHSIRGVGDKVELCSIRLEDMSFEASYHDGMRTVGDVDFDAFNGAAAGCGLRLAPHGPAAELASPVGMEPAAALASPSAAGAAALGGDAVGSRLGASLADTMAAQPRAWDVTGEELRNMLTE